MIPKLEEEIPKLQKLLLDEEKVLEEIKDSSKGYPIIKFLGIIQFHILQTHQKFEFLHF